MGKRKRRFENKTTKELLNTVEWYVEDTNWMAGNLYCLLNNKTNPGEYLGNIEKTVNNIEKNTQEIQKLLNILKNNLVTEEVRIEPERNITKGKGKLNLHETDKELRQREANSNY